MSTPLLDQPLSRLSSFANHSKPWFLAAGALAIVGGPAGRRAALTGVAAIGATSLVVNQPMKRLRRRVRPARHELEVPQARWVPMPTSTSFPSGHSASAAAFAVAVGAVLPQLRWPLGVAAGVVGLLPRLHRRALPGRRDRRGDHRSRAGLGHRPRRAAPDPLTRRRPARRCRAGRRRSDVEPVGVHHLHPGRDERRGEAVLRVVTGVDLGDRPEFGVGREHQVDPAARPDESA